MENKEILQRLKFLRDEIQKSQKEICEKQSIYWEIEKEYFDNLEEIEKLEKELKVLESTVFVTNKSARANDPDFVVLVSPIWSEIPITYKSNKENKILDTLTLLPRGLSEDETTHLVKEAMKEARRMRIRGLENLNKKLEAGLRSETEGFKK